MQNLEKSQQISKIMISLKSLNNLDKNLDAAKSRFKRLNFKNVELEKKLSCLNSKDNLDTFQK